MSGGPTDWLRAAIGDDGTSPLWRRLNRRTRDDPPGHHIDPSQLAAQLSG
jgi:hypothetical protein